MRAPLLLAVACVSILCASSAPVNSITGEPPSVVQLVHIPKTGGTAMALLIKSELHLVVGGRPMQPTTCPSPTPSPTPTPTPNPPHTAPKHENNFLVRDDRPGPLGQEAVAMCGER